MWARDSHLDKEEVSLELQKKIATCMLIWCTLVTLSIPITDELLLNAEQGAGGIGLSGAKEKKITARTH